LANDAEVKTILNSLKEKKALVDNSVTELSNIYAQRPIIENIETNSSGKLVTMMRDITKNLGTTSVKTVTKV